MRRAMSTTANAPAHLDSAAKIVLYQSVDPWQMAISGYRERVRPVIVRMDGKASTATYARLIGPATL